MARVDPELTSESVREHNLARQKLSTELQAIQPTNATWTSPSEALKDLIRRHMDEKETAVFHVAKVTMSETQLNDLGTRFKQAESAIPGYAGAMSGTTGTMPPRPWLYNHLLEQQRRKNRLYWAMSTSRNPHRYFLSAYGLDRTINLQPGSSKSALLSAMKGQIVWQGVVMAVYGR